MDPELPETFQVTQPTNCFNRQTATSSTRLDSSPEPRSRNNYSNYSYTGFTEVTVGAMGSDKLPT